MALINSCDTCGIIDTIGWSEISQNMCSYGLKTIAEKINILNNSYTCCLKCLSFR